MRWAGHSRVFLECARAFLSNTRPFSFVLFMVLRGTSRSSESVAEGRRVQYRVQYPEAHCLCADGACYLGRGERGIRTLRDLR